MISETLKQSYLWSGVKSYKFTENMRLRGAGQNVKDFADYLNKVGNGMIEGSEEFGADMIEIPEKFRSKAKNLVEFCDQIYAGISISKSYYSSDQSESLINFFVAR